MRYAKSIRAVDQRRIRRDIRKARINAKTAFLNS